VLRCFYCYAECHYAECHYAECHFAECRYAECRYAECLYTECRYAECRGALLRADVFIYIFLCPYKDKNLQPFISDWLRYFGGRFYSIYDLELDRTEKKRRV
jgi:hypothetical protein